MNDKATTLPRKILVGFEGLGRSEPAVLAALDLAHISGASVEIVHVVDMHEPMRGTGRLRERAEHYSELETLATEHVRARVEMLLESVGCDHLRTDSLVVVRSGHPARVLIERCRTQDIDLLMLGPHEHHGLVDFGSTARAVLGKAHCHVWVQPGPTRQVRRVLVPLDLSEDSLAALRLACRLAKAWDAQITALHCWVPPFFCYSAQAVEMGGATSPYVIEADRREDREIILSELEVFDWDGVEHEVVIEEGPAQDLILARKDADLVVLGTHGRTGLAAAVLGNVAYGVMRRSEIPVLAVRLPRRRWQVGDLVGG